jgi:hypothetical protein
MPYGFAQVMRNAIAVNGSYFNTQRMVLQYAHNAYRVETAERPIQRSEVVAR